MSSQRILGALAALWLTGCASILGTGDYEPCGEGEGGCDADDGTTSSSSSSSGACAAGHAVTVTVLGSVKAELDDDDALDVDDGQTEQFCLPAGTHVLRARCDQGGGSDPPAPVAWGNDLCADGESSCTFVLEDDEQFVLDPVDCD